MISWEGEMDRWEEWDNDEKRRLLELEPPPFDYFWGMFGGFYYLLLFLAVVALTATCWV